MFSGIGSWPIGMVTDWSLFSGGCTPPGVTQVLSHAASCTVVARLASPRFGRWQLLSGVVAGIDQRQSAMVSFTGNISIQSTGQGSTQRSQPVHSSAITVCIKFGRAENRIYRAGLNTFGAADTFVFANIGDGFYFALFAVFGIQLWCRNIEESWRWH